MKEIKIIIERSKDGFFWAYAENMKGITGGGETVHDCKQDILDCIDLQRELGNFNLTENEYGLTYKFDAVSLFDYYKGIFTNAALERLTGINAKQLQHYASGLRKPRAKQLEKIETGLHRLGEELISLEL